MPNVDFEFRARGASTVRTEVRGVVAAARRASADATKLAVADANNRARAERQATAITAREASQRARLALQELAVRQRASTAEANNRARAERQATALAAREANQRLRLTQQEEAAKIRAATRALRAHETAERSATRIAEREAQRRAQADERTRGARGRSWGRRAEQGMQGALGYARDMHGQMQGARRSRAETEHTLNSAMYQAGVSGAEARALRAQVLREVETGRLQGLSADEVASSLAAAQTQFSVLSRGTRGMSEPDAAARRQQNLNDALSAAQLARDTYQDPGEVMRVAGMLGAQGVTGASQRSALLAMTGIAQAGSIELRDVVGQALGPLMQSIAAATAQLGPNATEADRANAVRQASVRTLAVGEVAAAAGQTPRDSLNAYAKLQRNLRSDVVTGHLHAALTARGQEGRQTASEIFENQRDARGRTVHRLRAGLDPLAVVARLQRFAGNSTQLANLLQGGGGESMVLDSQVRRFLGALSSQTTNGQSMADRVRGMLEEGSTFNENDVARGRTLVDSEQRTQLVAQEERRNAALTMDSAAMRFSNAVDRFTSNNPFLAAALGAAAPVALGAAANGAGGGIGSAAMTANALQSLAATAGTAGRALSTLGGVVAAAVAGIEAGHWLGNRIDEATRRTQTADGTQITYGPNQNGPSLWEAGTWRDLASGIGEHISAALRANPPVVAVSPQANAHASALTRTLAAAERNRL